jgi:transcriptional regulator with XRE-family HTH domain
MTRMTAPAGRFYTLLGRRIQEARRGRRMTQQRLGDMLVPPLSRAAIANMETGKQGVLVYTLAQIALALGTPVEILLPPLAVAENGTGLEAELTTKLPRAIGERLHEQLSRLPDAELTNERSSSPKRG